MASKGCNGSCKYQSRKINQENGSITEMEEIYLGTNQTEKVELAL